MKPKIWHLMGNEGIGGSNLLVKRLMESRLGDRFNFSLLSLDEAKARLRTEKPDCIIFHYACAWRYVADLLYLRMNSPLFIYDHHYCRGFEADRVPSQLRFRWLLRIAYGLANGVISVSQAQRQWMVSAKLIDPRKLRIIYPALAIESLLAIPPKTPSSPLILGAYGRFARQKGFDQFLEVMERLSPQKVQFYLGGFGPEQERVKALAANLPHVHLVGKVENIEAFLARCDGIVIPSRWEPFGTVCLEAKAAGKAVIVSGVDGLVEQVQDCGLVISPQDLDAWERAITELSPARLARWGKTGRESVLKSWDNCLNEWEDFLRKITGAIRA